MDIVQIGLVFRSIGMGELAPMTFTLRRIIWPYGHSPPDDYNVIHDDKSSATLPHDQRGRGDVALDYDRGGALFLGRRFLATVPPLFKELTANRILDPPERRFRL